MKTLRLIFLFGLFLFAIKSHAQHSNIETPLSINEDGSDPNSGAILDIQSSDKGVLIPRVDTSTVAQPTTGLLVYQPTDNSFYYYRGTTWSALLNSVGFDHSIIHDGDGDTRIQTEESPDEDVIRMDLNGDEILEIRRNAGDYTQYEMPNSNGTILLGENAGESLTSGSSNIIIGQNAAETITNSQQNVIIGADASNDATNGGQSIVIGYQAAENSLNNNQSTVIGFQAAENANQVFNNVLIGRRAGQNTVGGSNNIAIGQEAGRSLENAGSNVFIGFQANASGDGGSDNVALGSGAGRHNEGDHNVFIGPLAGENNRANDNVYIGQSAGTNNETGINNIAIGPFAGSNNLNGSQNIYMGQDAGRYDTSSYNIILGQSAARDGSGGDGNIVVGRSAAQQSIPGSGSVVIGDRAALSSRVFDGNVIMGNRAAYSVDSLYDNVVIGEEAFEGTGIGTASDNVIIGKSAASNADAGIQENTIIGSRSAFNLTLGERNTTLGYNAAHDIEFGSDNVSIGAFALQQNTDGNENVAVGNMALQNPFETGTFEQYRNTAIGHKAAWTLAGDGNIAMGHEAGNNMEDGDDNIYIGNQSGTKDGVGTAIGNDNIFIGNNTTYSPAVGGATIQNSVAIGHGAELALPNTIIIGANNPDIEVGIGTSVPSSKLDVEGRIKCQDPVDEDDAVTLGYLRANYPRSPQDIHINKDSTFNLAECATYCRELDLNGHDDWHLPSIEELVHFAGLDTALLFTSTLFDGVSKYAYSSQYAHDADAAYAYAFSGISGVNIEIEGGIGSNPTINPADTTIGFAETYSGYYTFSLSDAAIINPVQLNPPKSCACVR